MSDMWMNYGWWEPAPSGWRRWLLAIGSLCGALGWLLLTLVLVAAPLIALVVDLMD